jgi:tRNA modification GTPase
MRKRDGKTGSRPTDKDETICAISTPLGEGGIGIIRISGPEAIAVVDRIFVSSCNDTLRAAPSHTLQHGHIIHPATHERIDEVLIGVMHGPRSYTREDVVEINGHGGPVLLHRVLELLIHQGARLAEPGEFTKRAFLNGRFDLTQAEAVMDLIRAKTDVGCRAAMKRLEGGLGREIRDLREKLSLLLAYIEAAIDFPEEDLEILPRPRATEDVRSALSDVKRLIESAVEGRILQEGLATVIIGRPNVGKSSLLNGLLQQDRAIVTSIPGTTRDLLEGYLNIKGLPLRVVDTAGLRTPADDVEQEGIRRTESAIAEADLILVVVDASDGLVTEEEDLLRKHAAGKKAVLVINKIDIAQSAGKTIQQKLEGLVPSVLVSATKGEGLEELKDTIKNVAIVMPWSESDGVRVANFRHKIALLAVQGHLDQALSSIQTGMPEDIIAVDVRASLDRLGEIVGETTTEDILSRIFQTFCIGK